MCYCGPLASWPVKGGRMKKQLKLALRVLPFVMGIHMGESIFLAVIIFCISSFITYLIINVLQEVDEEQQSPERFSWQSFIGYMIGAIPTEIIIHATNLGEKMKNFYGYEMVAMIAIFGIFHGWRLFLNDNKEHEQPNVAP